MSRNESDVEARLRELEATVRGLTQELVDANERIRALEAAAEAEPAEKQAIDPATLVDVAGNGQEAPDQGQSTEGEDTRQMEEQVVPEEEEADDHELDDIIVA